MNPSVSIKKKKQIIENIKVYGAEEWDTDVSLLFCEVLSRKGKDTYMVLMIAKVSQELVITLDEWDDSIKDLNEEIEVSLATLESLCKVNINTLKVLYT